MTTSIDAVLAVAASQIGGRFPGASPYGNWYAQRHGSVYRNAQFCAMGLSWCFSQVDGLDIFPEHAYTPSGAAWFKARGQWHTGSISNIRRGDVPYFNFPDSLNRIQHVGIAERDGYNGKVQTIEFNTTGFSGGSESNGRMVVRKLRSAYIVGWGRPNYASVPKASFHGIPGVHTGRLTPDGNYELVQDGDLGGASLMRWNQIMGTPLSGGKSRDLIRADQKFLNSVLAGQGHLANLDPNKRRRQDYLSEDGLDDFEGTHTSAARQYWLRHAMGQQHQVNLIGKLLDFDGIFHAESIKVLQFALNQANVGSKRYGQVA